MDLIDKALKSGIRKFIATAINTQSCMWEALQFYLHSAEGVSRTKGVYSAKNVMGWSRQVWG